LKNQGVGRKSVVFGQHTENFHVLASSEGRGAAPEVPDFDRDPAAISGLESQGMPGHRLHGPADQPQVCRLPGLGDLGRAVLKLEDVGRDHVRTFAFVSDDRDARPRREMKRFPGQ
jgi:hypothetical protein